VLLTADNHLDPTVLQFGPKRMERKADYLKCFDVAFNYALENKPDLFLVSGDLHDSVLPRNPPRALMVSHFRELHDKGIRVFLIGGHHDTPRSVEHGSSPLAVYGNSGYATFFQSTVEPGKAIVDVSGKRVFIAGVSYNPDLPPGADPLEKLSQKPEGDINIFMLHYPIEGFRGFFGYEPQVRATSVPTGFQLIAAGHLHQHQKRKIQNGDAIYPGSTERKSFLEEGEEKGFVWLELDETGVLYDEFIKTPARKMESCDFNLPDKGNVSEILKGQLERFVDPELILRVRLLGSIDADLLTTYRRPALLSDFAGKFFYLWIDDKSMDVSTGGPIEALPRTTPLQELRRYYTAAIGEAATEEKKQQLDEALRLSEKMLEEEGAW